MQKHQLTTNNTIRLLGWQIFTKNDSWFCNKTLLFNNMRNSNFSWGKMQQKRLWRHKKWHVLNHLYSHIVYKMKQQLILTPRKKAIGGVLSHEGHSIIYAPRKLTPVEQIHSKIEREALAVRCLVKRLKQFFLGRRFTLQWDH